jgi:Nickel responsive protein SCO4226-like
MPRFLILRTFDVEEAEMSRVGRRSRVLVEEHFPTITWEHSHVVVDDSGGVRTYCIYGAPSEKMVREHAAMLGEHTVDEIHEIAGDVTPDDFPG